MSGVIANPPGECCTKATLFEGTPSGKDIKITNGNDAYLAEAATPTKKAVLYIPDIFGIWQNSKLMADSFAAKGYTTLIPDIFNGDALTLPFPEGFDLFKWFAEGSSGDNPHDAEHIDPIVKAGIDALKGMGYTSIASVGYCIGAKYTVRHYKSGIQVGFGAHPSFVSEEEFNGITGPFSIAAAETDEIFPQEKRWEAEKLLNKMTIPWEIRVFSGTEHGFAARGDPAVKQQRFAKERAFQQAVDWFDEHLN